MTSTRTRGKRGRQERALARLLKTLTVLHRAGFSAGAGILYEIGKLREKLS